MSGASDGLVWAVGAVGAFVIHLATVLRAITRPNRTPASRVAWIAVIMCLPVIGVVAYLFLGETSIGRERARRLRDAESRLAAPSGAGAEPDDPVASSVSDLCRSINGFGATRGNRVVLLGDLGAPPAEPTRDCDAAIKGLIEAFDAATEHIHLSFYIWLDDENGGRVADAISAAARRGVACRVMADALGSRDFIRGPRWRQLREAGVHLLAALEDIPRLGSTYPDLLACGVRLFEYPLGLLHTKSITLDERIALVGSANMDRRSLELNFENNLLVFDPGLTATIRQRQLGYLSQSTAVKAETVRARPF